MITFIDETGSTNADLAVALRADPQPSEGDWLVAFRQNAGRGRQGREWFDGAGNFMGSTVVALRDGSPPPATLSFVAALAVFEAASRVLPEDCALQLKWPNDVLLEGGKLSGILLEMVGRCVVVGIGVNLKHAPDVPDRKTAAIAHFGPAPHPRQFAEVLAGKFASTLARWRSEGLQTILADFQAKSIHTSGSAVTVHDSDASRVEGSFAGLDPCDGALRLRLADGSERVIRAGDIV